MGVFSRQDSRIGASGVLAQPRALGDAHLVAGPVAGRTRLRDLRQSGALKLVFPRAENSTALTAVMVNTAGGITGGDKFFLTAEVATQGQLTMTTQAAERVYRAVQDHGQVNNRLSVGAGASLHWLPQETILFERSALRRRLTIDLAPDARLLLVEPLVFGRRAMGEVLQHISFDDRILVRRGDAPVYLDGMRLTTGAALDRPALAAGAGAAAQLVLIAPQARDMLDAVRAHLPATGAASLIGADMLVLRVLASDSFALRQSLLPILDLLTFNQLPTSWRL